MEEFIDSGYNARMRAGAMYHIKKEKRQKKRQKMKRDLFIAVAVMLFGMMVGSFLTLGLMPPKVTHEIYLYRPKVKNSERVEFYIEQIETDSVAERRWLHDLLRKKRP